MDRPGWTGGQEDRKLNRMVSGAGRGKCLGCTADSDSVVPADSVSVVPAAHPFVLSILKSVLLLTCTLSAPTHPTQAHPCCLNLALDLYVIIPTQPHPTLWSYLCSSLSCSWPVRCHPHPPPHPCRYNWAQILDFVGTSETNTCRYKWVKSVGASEPLPAGRRKNAVVWWSAIVSVSTTSESNSMDVWQSQGTWIHTTGG